MTVTRSDPNPNCFTKTATGIAAAGVESRRYRDSLPDNRDSLPDTPEVCSERNRSEVSIANETKSLIAAFAAQHDL